MTVFFYSGITSYPGVSTEEKTIPHRLLRFSKTKGYPEKFVNKVKSF